MKTIRNAYSDICRGIYTFVTAPSSRSIQIMLFVLGVSLLTAGIVSGAVAEMSDNGEVNSEKLNLAVQKIFNYIEGSFGVLIMVVSGLGAIMSSAFGQYRAALGCLVVAVGAFILRSVAATFFNTDDVFAD